MRITIDESKHAALSRQTVKLNAPTSSPHAPRPCHHVYAPRPHRCPTRTTSTHFPRCNSPMPTATPRFRPSFLNPLAPQPTHTTTNPSQPPIHSPTSTAHTLHHQHPVGQPYNPTQTHPDRPIQPSRPNTLSNYGE